MNSARSISWFNRLYLALFAVGALGAAVSGEWWMSAALVLALAVVAIFIVRSLRGRGSDLTRISAAQPYDERDRAASTWSFAVVGMAAIIGQTALVVAGLVRDGVADPLVLVQFLILMLVWSVAATVAVRRG